MLLIRHSCSRGFLPLYLRERYHISDWHSEWRFQGNKDYFNHRHSCVHNIIECTFGVLKSRFKILRYIPAYSVGQQGNLIKACCTLHNFIQTATPDDWLFKEWTTKKLDPNGRAVADAAEPHHPDMSTKSAQAMATIRDEIVIVMWPAHDH